MSLPAGKPGRAEAPNPGDARRRLDAAVKTYDGFFSTFFVNPYTKHLARAAARLGIGPHAITLASLAVGLAAAGCFATGARPCLVGGAIALLASFYLDGTDGTLARYTGRPSAFGAWLDTLCDRTKEYAVYAGLAVGSTRGFDDDVWLLAASALALQTIRHLGDTAYVSVRPGGAAGASGPRTPSAARWIHRIVRFPVGERLLVIAVTAALWSPRTTFAVLLAWGGLAWLYTVTGRVAYELFAARRVLRGPVG